MPYIPSPIDPGPSGAPVAPPTPPGVLQVDLDAKLRSGGQPELTPGQQAIFDAVPMVRAPELDQYFSNSRVYRVVGRAAQLPIVLVEPVGDRWPCHVFWAPMPEPLGPVLREDRAPAGSLLDALGFWLEADLPDEPPPPSIHPPLSHSGVPASVPRRPPLRARLSRFWEDYHEWIAVAVILAAAATAAVLGPRRVAAAPSPVPVASTPDLPRHA